MKNIITTSILVITILNTYNAIAETHAECSNAIAQEYLAALNTYKSTGVCPSGGRLQAFSVDICNCFKSGKPVSAACPAAQRICCVGDEVTSTNNHVQTVKKYTWNASTNGCSTTTIYRCETGYWGNPTSASAGCSQCPPYGGLYRDSGRTVLVFGTTAGPGGTARTDCLVPGGKYYDASGELEITGNCMYM